MITVCLVGSGANAWEIDIAKKMSGQNLSIRLNSDNPNHHLWNNNGTWFIHYTVHPDALTAVRVRRSLGTAELSEARSRRDAYLDRAHCTAGGGI